MDEDLLSIGELAARSGLSPKALRLYAASELLPPRRVDPVTGYRSYGRDQVERARLIAALRGVGMGLARIRVLCDLDAGAAATELRSWWRQEQADASSRAAAVGALARDLRGLAQEDSMTTDITTAPAAAAALDPGRVRPTQQDAVLVRELPGRRVLLAVADGFGADDDLAQRLLAALADSLATDSGEPGDPLAALETAWAAAEALVPADGSDGATLTAALIDGDRAHIAHIGDSRAVLVHGERIEEITQDHTQVRSLLAAGRLTPEEAADHPDRRILNRALAPGAPTAPDLLVRRIVPGDVLLLMTDGMHALVDPSALAATLIAGGDLEALARGLVDLALDAGGEDNVALALARR
ncbi:MerR family transcriptional regulator [Brachybacterium sp. YJGR34]|uniref:MerR family transcriptional regulator n=1 Tax=Brachybacterium sp. YJGR34 TaxID=2059911 RepID=UPI000E0B6761|nr:MerR family transcriptional regulator [Brachybacterium sp. YJGR34]